MGAPISARRGRALTYWVGHREIHSSSCALLGPVDRVCGEVTSWRSRMTRSHERIHQSGQYFSKKGLTIITTDAATRVTTAPRELGDRAEQHQGAAAGFADRVDKVKDSLSGLEGRGVGAEVTCDVQTSTGRHSRSGRALPDEQRPRHWRSSRGHVLSRSSSARIEPRQPRTEADRVVLPLGGGRLRMESPHPGDPATTRGNVWRSTRAVELRSLASPGRGGHDDAYPAEQEVLP